MKLHCHPRVGGDPSPRVRAANDSFPSQSSEAAYYVYIMTNKPGGTLYIGITNDLPRRIYEHKEGLIDGFTKKYGLNMLVYYEAYENVLEAIAREKAMKKWNREWKINRITEMNPDWQDLSLAFH